MSDLLPSELILARSKCILVYDPERSTYSGIEFWWACVGLVRVFVLVVLRKEFPPVEEAIKFTAMLCLRSFEAGGKPVPVEELLKTLEFDPLVLMMDVFKVAFG